MRATAASRQLQAAMRGIRKRRSTILCYHGVARSTVREDPKFLRTDPRRLRQHLELLLGAGFELTTVSEMARRIGHGPPPPGLAALTFDDGYDDNHRVLLPLLREFEVPATVYVVTGYIGRPNPFLPHAPGARMMTGEELRELARAGVELGAHTVSHPDLSSLGYERCLAEMSESRAVLEDLVGRTVSTFAYPYGRYTEATLAAARDAGFLSAVASGSGGSWARLELRRPVMTGKDGLATFLLKVADRHEDLHRSLPGRVLRAATRGPRVRRHELRARGG